MTQRERLEQEIEHLKQKLNRCFEKRLLTDDPEKEIDLEALENKLDAQITQKEHELNQLSDSGTSKNRRSLDLDEGLCQLDFDAAKAKVRAAVKHLEEQEGGSALFLMERCLDMEGRLMLMSLRDILRAKTLQLREYPVDFIPTMPASELTFLKMLGAHLNVSLNADEDGTAADLAQQLSESSEAVVTQLAGLLRSGTTILIPLGNWHKLGIAAQARFLDWFMQDFWPKMVGAVECAMQDYAPKMFFVIMVDDEMSPSCQEQARYFCEDDDTDSGRMVRLPLACWTQADVRGWLNSYSAKLTKGERRELVKFIFEGKAEDLPNKIRQRLEHAHAQSCF